MESGLDILKLIWLHFLPDKIITFFFKIAYVFSKTQNNYEFEVYFIILSKGLHKKNVTTAKTALRSATPRLS